jgi:hypothetical protein
MAKKQTKPQGGPPVGPPDLSHISEQLRALAVPCDLLTLDPSNVRTHPDRNLEAIKGSLLLYKQQKPIVVRRGTNVVVAGNGTLEAARALGWSHVAAVYTDMSPIEATGFAIADNRTAELAEWDTEALSEQLAALQAESVDLLSLGWSQEDMEQLLNTAPPSSNDDEETKKEEQPAERPTLADRFLVPPFSVLDARQGYWQERKRGWISLGIRSEVGRGGSLLGGSLYDHATHYLFDNDNKAKEFVDELRQQGTPDSEILSEIARRAGLDKLPEEAEPGGHPIPGGGTGKKAAWMHKQADGSHKPKEGAVNDKEKGKFRGGNKAGGRVHPSHAFGMDMKGNPPTGPTYRSGGPDDLSKGMSSRVESPSLSGAALAVHTTTNPYRRPGAEVEGAGGTGTSIFDPVLCELVYRWFCPPEGAILDPFAGGSVRGIVASVLNRGYTGIDLSAVQVDANRAQAEEITPARKPTWHTGDSRNVKTLAPGRYDLVFSCPPYAFLEVYSEDPSDLSTLSYEEFLAAYRKIISDSCSMLKNNRFACFVVGDVRDPKTGAYCNFVSDTIRAFLDAGMKLYNEAILVTAVGSLPIRVGKQFEGARKLGKTHQNVLVFIKGDGKVATGAVGPVEVVGIKEEAENMAFEAGIASEPN